MTQLVSSLKFKVGICPITDKDWVDIGQLTNYNKYLKLNNQINETKILFAAYDNGSYDHIFPMGFGALAAVLKRDGHDITVWVRISIIGLTII